MSCTSAKTEMEASGVGRSLWARALSLLSGVQQRFQNRPTRLLRVRETLAIGEKRQLLIVQCGEKHLLIAAAGNFVATLAELPHGSTSQAESV